MDKNRSNTNVAAIYPADVVTSKTIDTFSKKENEDYEHLQKWYLEKQVRTGSGAELPSDMQLRRMVRASKVEAYPSLKKNLESLKRREFDGERYRLLTLLRDYETYPSNYNGRLPGDLTPDLIRDNDVCDVIEIDVNVDGKGSMMNSFDVDVTTINVFNNVNSDYESNSSSRSTRIGTSTSCSRYKTIKGETNANQKNKQEQEQSIMVTNKPAPATIQELDVRVVDLLQNSCLASLSSVSSLPYFLREIALGDELTAAMNYQSKPGTIRELDDKVVHLLQNSCLVSSLSSSSSSWSSSSSLIMVPPRKNIPPSSNHFNQQPEIDERVASALSPKENNNTRTTITISPTYGSNSEDDILPTAAVAPISSRSGRWTNEEHEQLSNALSDFELLKKQGGPVPKSFEKMYETIAKYYVTTRTVEQVRNYVLTCRRKEKRRQQNKRRKKKKNSYNDTASGGIAAVRNGALPRTLFNRCEGFEHLKTTTLPHKRTHKSKNYSSDDPNREEKREWDKIRALVKAEMQIKIINGHLDISNNNSCNHDIVLISSKASMKESSKQSKTKGCHKTSTGGYYVQLCYRWRRIYIGTYRSENEAAVAYTIAKNEASRSPALILLKKKGRQR